jgi:hypothetical protein
MDAPAPTYVDNVGGQAIVLTLLFDERLDKGSVVWRRSVVVGLPPVVRIPFDNLSPGVRGSLNDTIAKHNASTTLSPVECRSLWHWRRALTDRPGALPLVVRAAPIGGGSMSAIVDEIHSLLRVWRAPDEPLMAVTLLDVRVVDAAVRRWAVTQLERVKDDDLMFAMMPLVQCVKGELYHDSALARFLLRRAVGSPRIGQRLFWLLHAELQRDAWHATRFGLMLEAYLRTAPLARMSLMRQQEWLGLLADLTWCVVGHGGRHRVAGPVEKLDSFAD